MYEMKQGITKSLTMESPEVGCFRCVEACHQVNTLEDLGSLSHGVLKRASLTMEKESSMSCSLKLQSAPAQASLLHIGSCNTHFFSNGNKDVSILTKFL